tara:strand:- start:2576 stop:2902 length:327 start_codon:yes stop_codon:yes gene_type:complete
MATNKTFTVAGVSTFNGVTKVRFANDFVARIKILDKNGHTDVNLKEFDTPMTKAQVCETLLSDTSFQDEASQGAISEFVVRNCVVIAAEVEAALSKVTDAEVEQVTAS